MLRDLVSREQVANRQNFPKNNYFCYKWRVKDNFNRSIDRQMFHLSVHGADNHKSLMSHKMLQLHKSRFKGNRRDMVVNLAQDAMEFLEQRRLEHSVHSNEQVIYSTAMTDMVEMCFNLLLSCATELNTILGLSELFITATEPNFEIKDKTKETVCSYTQCRFSTSLYSLVMEGRREKINFYIVPSDELISVEEVALQYESITKWSATMNKNKQAVWMSQGMELNDDVLEVSAIQLLSQLIDKTKERLVPITEQDSKEQEFALFEDDPWQKETSGYTSTSTELPTATSTTISAISTSNDLKKVSAFPQYESSSSEQPEQYRNQQPLELQTLETVNTVDSNLFTGSIVQSSLETEILIKQENNALKQAEKSLTDASDTKQKQPRKSQKKQSRRKRKKKSRK